MNESVLPKARPELDIRAAGGESVVHDPASGMIHVLNGSAASILQRLDGRTSLDAIAADIVARTGAAPERVAADLERVCADFRAKGLLL